MLRFALGRLLSALAALVLLTIATFLLVRMMPGRRDHEPYRCRRCQ